MSHNPSFLALVESARQHIEETDVATVKQLLDEREDFVLIDVREESEWAAGHIPGAIHLGKGIIERDIETCIPEKNKKLILYCGGGYRSALAASNLKKMGYTQVISMDGGMRGWRQAAFPVE